MPTPSAPIDLLHEQMANADTQWSLGTFGGIAEFSRDRDEQVSLTKSAAGASAHKGERRQVVPPDESSAPGDPR